MKKKQLYAKVSENNGYPKHYLIHPTMLFYESSKY